VGRHSFPGPPHPIRATASLEYTLVIWLPCPAADLEFPLVVVQVYIGIIDVVQVHVAFTGDTDLVRTAIWKRVVVGTIRVTDLLCLDAAAPNHLLPITDLVRTATINVNLVRAAIINVDLVHVALLVRVVAEATWVTDATPTMPLPERAITDTCLASHPTTSSNPIQYTSPHRPGSGSRSTVQTGSVPLPHNHLGFFLFSFDLVSCILLQSI
jgi:hypothetical protein